MEGQAVMEHRNGFNCEGTTKMEEEAKRVVQDIDQITVEEQHKILQMREFVERHDPASKEVDNLMIRRFLQARDLDIEKASAMFLKYLKWRREFIPNGYISISEIPNELAQNKLFVQGSDKQGRPVTIFFGRSHFQNKKGGVDEFKRLMAFTFDKLCSSMPRGQEQFVVIGDLAGWGYSNSDIRGYLGALSVLQDYYPERLGRLYLVHVPYIFMKVWNILCPFIDKNTRKKIIFVNNKQLKSTLLEDIEESQLPAIYGGKLPLIPVQDS